MKAFATVGLLGVLVAAFAVAAVITLNTASAGEERNEAAALAGSFYGNSDAARSRPAVTGASGQLPAVMRELLDGDDLDTEQVVTLLEHAVAAKRSGS